MITIYTPNLMREHNWNELNVEEKQSEENNVQSPT